MYERNRDYPLINLALKDVNPHSTQLTVDQQLAILEECKINPEYFFAAVCRYEVDVEKSFHNAIAMTTHFSVNKANFVVGREPQVTTIKEAEHLADLIAATNVRPQAKIIVAPVSQEVAALRPRLPFLDPLNIDN